MIDSMREYISIGMNRKVLNRAKILFVLLLILYLLTAGIAMAEESAAPVPLPFRSDYPEARELADSYQEKYGVVILFGEDCLGVSEEDGFAVGDRAPAGSPFLAMFGNKHYLGEVEKLGEALAQYPDGFLGSLRNEYAPSGLRFLIANRLVEETYDLQPEVGVSGLTTCEGGFYNVFLAHTFAGKLTVHHELWHIMEEMILIRDPDAFADWNDLNPPGFQYSEDYGSYQEESQKEYFARTFGMVNPEEDRATIAEAVFYENRNEWFSERPAVKRKLDAMNLTMRDILNIQYNVKVEEDGQTALQ